MTGAIFCETRPAMIIKSACRGDGRNTSEPKRATSKRDAAMDIISIAQQAKPNPSGQMELLRAQFTALSSCVKIMPSSCSSLPKSSGFSRVTFLPTDMLMGLVFSLTTLFSHTLRLRATQDDQSRQWDGLQPVGFSFWIPEKGTGSSPSSPQKPAT